MKYLLDFCCRMSPGRIWLTGIPCISGLCWITWDMGSWSSTGTWRRRVRHTSTSVKLTRLRLWSLRCSFHSVCVCVCVCVRSSWRGRVLQHHIINKAHQREDQWKRSQDDTRKEAGTQHSNPLRWVFRSFVKADFKLSAIQCYSYTYSFY